MAQFHIYPNPGMKKVEVPEQGLLVLSTDEIFAIDTGRLKASLGMLSLSDRAKIKPAVDKVIGEY